MAVRDDSVQSMEHTPTWALATWLKRHKKIALFGAVEKLKSDDASADSLKINHFVEKFSHNMRQLLAHEEDGDVADSCSAKGNVALMTKDGIYQLHIFIFVLAATQVVFSTVTMDLGRAKMRRWKAWEKEKNN